MKTEYKLKEMFDYWELMNFYKEYPSEGKVTQVDFSHDDYYAIVEVVN